MLNTAALTVAVLGILLTALSLNVSRLRIRHKQSFGDGGHKDLEVAIRAHGNTLEQSLLFGLLLLVMEWSHAGSSFVAAVAGLFVAARLLHTFAIFQRKLRLRQMAHLLSLICQLALILALLGLALR